MERKEKAELTDSRDRGRQEADGSHDRTFGRDPLLLKDDGQRDLRRKVLCGGEYGRKGSYVSE